MKNMATQTGKKFNPEQQQAIEYGEGPLLIIAGAGTGKTTVVTERIKHLITSGKVKPHEILALTFTEKASKEMEERVDQALPYGVFQMWISTFHSFCDRVLRAEGVHIGINPGFRLMSEAEAILFLRSRIFQFDLQYFRPLGNPIKFVSGMLQHFARLKDEDVSPKQYSQWVKDDLPAINNQQEELDKYHELESTYALYEDLKVKEGVFDYSDLISFTLRLFRERPNILKRYQEQFPFILIDEFQDTNYSQNELAILLSGKKKNLTVVGDDDQAVYRWRGAAVSNMIQFRSHFPKAQIIVLTKNYRSTKEILDRSYELIQYNNPDRMEVLEKIDKHLESMRRVKGEAISVIYADRVENEAEEVVKKIQDAKNQEPKFRWKDFAILVRANNHSLPFTRALERNGIPYQFLGPGQLLRQGEVKDLIAYLTLLASIDDSVAMYRVLTMDWFGVSARDVAAFMSVTRRNGLSLFEVCERVADNTPIENLRLTDPETTEKIAGMVAMIHKHLGLIRKETAGQILYEFLEESGLLVNLTQYKTERQERIAQNIAKFFDRLKTYETEHEDASVFAVIDWLNLSLELGESPLASNNDWSENDAVNIMTVHSAKGLEFPVVFLVNLVSQRFPSSERKEQIPIPDQLVREILPTGDFHLQEERRLFYVGMTRAKDRLFFTAAKYYGDGKREKKLSPFIAEAVGPDVTEKALLSPVGETKQLSLLEWSTKEPSPLNSHPSSPKQSITYLSYSQLDTFMTCPLQYKYRYVVKIPVPSAAALSFGDSMHRTVREFYEKVRLNQKPTVDDLLAIYKELWSSHGYANKRYEEKMKLHGVDLLKGFYENAYNPNNIPRNLEEPFRIRITPTLKLGGKIDRIDSLPDGRIEIIDYKTGKAPKGKDPGKDLQLTVYALAATDQGIYGYRPEDVIVSFYFFEGQEKVSGQRTKEQLEKAREEIAKKADEIATSTFSATPGRQCDFCEFRLICDAWQ